MFGGSEWIHPDSPASNRVLSKHLLFDGPNGPVSVKGVLF